MTLVGWFWKEEHARCRIEGEGILHLVERVSFRLGRTLRENPGRFEVAKGESTEEVTREQSFSSEFVLSISLVFCLELLRELLCAENRL